jgi:hypothetical protein
VSMAARRLAAPASGFVALGLHSANRQARSDFTASTIMSPPDMTLTAG